MLKSLSEQRRDCTAEIKFLGERLDHVKSRPRPNPIAVLRLENLLKISQGHLAEIELQEKDMNGDKSVRP